MSTETTTNLLPMPLDRNEGWHFTRNEDGTLGYKDDRTPKVGERLRAFRQINGAWDPDAPCACSRARATTRT